jgi:glyoxylase-like metal-dependent hydrolase (beta-lactamase superfamily II)
MKIHHLNCCTFCPLGGHLIDGVTPGFGKARLVCHCLLVESNDRLILIDTGLGMNDIYHAKQRLNTSFRHQLNPMLLEQETAIAQIKNLGFSPTDVRHILLTHLDLDHAGGIDDFNKASVHVMEAESLAAQNPVGRIAKNRYSQAQLSGIKNWNTYRSQGEAWFGFESVRDLKGLPPEILFVPLRGHTEGHTGIAVKTAQGWLLHAGDAYYYRGEMESTP